jgi:hypothetical protein
VAILGTVLGNLSFIGALGAAVCIAEPTSLPTS